MKKWNPYADTILKHANIYTADTDIEKIRNGIYDFPVIEDGYIAIKDGKIIEVGETWNPSLEGPQTKLLDVQGKTVIPGLIDSHMHAMKAGLAMKFINCSTCTSLEDMLGRIRERVAGAEEGTWLKASAFNELSWNDGQRPTRENLDAVTGENPFIAARLCGHVIVANSKAMEIAGITKNTPDPEGGTIGKDTDGNLTGWFYEPAAMELIDRCYPKPSEADYVEAIADIGDYMHSVGLSSVIDCNLDFEETRAYSVALANGKLGYRANVSFYMDKALGDVKYHINRLNEMMAVTNFGNDMLKFNGVKILFDGIPASGTAYMRKNYKHMPQTRGFTTITGEELEEVAEAAAKNHWQMAVHAIGDAAMDLVLNAYEKAAEKYDVSKNRNYIIHAVFPREDMLSKFKKLNIAVTLQPTIMGCMGEEAVLDEIDSEVNQPAGWYFKNGIICGGSTDCPVVDCNPFLGMSKAVSRVCFDGRVHGSQNRVTPQQALLMWTLNSAYLCHAEEKTGSITVGKYADLVIIDTPILQVDAEQIAQTKVEQMFLNGKLVYSR